MQSIVNLFNIYYFRTKQRSYKSNISTIQVPKKTPKLSNNYRTKHELSWLLEIYWPDCTRCSFCQWRWQ